MADDDSVRDAILSRDLWGWLGLDEFGSGEVGLKQAYCPAGLIPQVALDRRKVDGPDTAAQLQLIATQFGKARYLVRFTAVEIVRVIEP